MFGALNIISKYLLELFFFFFFFLVCLFKYLFGCAGSELLHVNLSCGM